MCDCSAQQLAEHLPLRARPTCLDLTRSLSKLDSDLLASPLEEENGVLDGQSGSVSNDILGQSSTVYMHSFASVWDEVIFNGRETSLATRSLCIITPDLVKCLGILVVSKFLVYEYNLNVDMLGWMEGWMDGQTL